MKANITVEKIQIMKRIRRQLIQLNEIDSKNFLDENRWNKFGRNDERGG